MILQWLRRALRTEAEARRAVKPAAPLADLDPIEELCGILGEPYEGGFFKRPALRDAPSFSAFAFSSREDNIRSWRNSSVPPSTASPTTAGIRNALYSRPRASHSPLSPNAGRRTSTSIFLIGQGHAIGPSNINRLSEQGRLSALAPRGAIYVAR